MTKEYRVSVDNDEWVAPEETLLDSLSSYQDIERPISGNVFRFTMLGIGVGFLVILGFVGNLAIIHNKEYDDIALRNRTVNFSIPPPRGIIYDRNGQALVSNEPVFNLVGVSRELKENTTLESDNSRIASILKIPPDQFQAAIADEVNKGSVFFAADDLSKDEVLAIKFLDAKGFYVIADNRRNYPDGAKYSSIIGYSGKVSKNDLDSDPYYTSTDTIGRAGLELAYEDYLRGQHGRIVLGNADNNEDVSDTDSVVGDGLVLNIDSGLQSAVYNSMSAILKEAGLSRGAVVVENPQNGQILSMVSFPSYDNNIFSRSITDAEYKNLFQSKLKPLFNRVIGGQYNPGSTIKPLIGMMALKEKVVTPADTITDCISISFPNPANPADPYVFKNWRVEYGPFNLRKAIANSCNIYFFTVGGGFGRIAGLGIERIAKYLKASFADTRTGIDLLGEATGFIPTPDWKMAQKNEPWYQGDTYNTSIGQGDLLVTPIWLSSYVSAIANGGTFYKPEVVSKIVDAKGQSVKEFNPSVLGSLPFGPYEIGEIHRDMEETVISGTAQIMKDLPVKVAAKTGTAEVVKGQSINSLFISFAPSDKPEIAITVLIEGSASNQGYAIRTAHEIFKWYFTHKNQPVPAP